MRSSPSKQPKAPAGEDLIVKGLANVIKVKDGSLVKTNFDTYTKNVEAILINPNWNTNSSKPVPG